MKPIIGLNLAIENDLRPKASIFLSYLTSITKSGGIPLPLPPMSNDDLAYMLTRLDGVVFIGGPDYSPELYGENLCAQTELIDPIRQDFDIRFIKQALAKQQLPILGICNGMQLMNISLGGSLIQDLPTAHPESTVTHRVGADCASADRIAGVQHEINLDPQSMISRIYNMEKISVNSFHHQAIKNLGHGLTSVAFAQDGIVESVEIKDHPFAIGVQWHPERDFENNKPLFQEFIRQASIKHSSK